MQALAEDESPDMSAPRAALLKRLDELATKDWLAVLRGGQKIPEFDACCICVHAWQHEFIGQNRIRRCWSSSAGTVVAAGMAPGILEQVITADSAHSLGSSRVAR